LTGINMDYGDYDWSLSPEERDANQNGRLTLGEYVPAPPFGEIDPLSWPAAGQALRDALSSLIAALAPACLPTDPDSLIQRALADAQESDIQQVREYLADALEVLSGQVTVEVEYARWESDATAHTAAWVDQGTAQVPLNLREAWDNPPASIRAMLSPLYTMLHRANYLAPSQPDLFRLDFHRWTGNEVEYLVSRGPGVAPMVIGTGPHHMVLPSDYAGPLSPGAQLDFSADWSTCTVTMDEESIEATRDKRLDHWILPYTWVPRWDEIPDQTMSGIFPDPEQVRDLILAEYDRLVIRYGSFEIVQEPEWVY